jgi:hypothetical protein
MTNESSAGTPGGADNEPARAVAARRVEALVPKLAVASVSVAAVLAALMQPPPGTPPTPQQPVVVTPVPAPTLAGTDQP